MANSNSPLLESLKKVALPEDWYVDPAHQHSGPFPSEGFVVVTPDRGACAWFSDVIEAYGHALLLIANTEAH